MRKLAAYVPIIKYPYDANLHQKLQTWEQEPGNFPQYSFDGPQIKPVPLAPDLASVLAKYMKLRKGDTPSDLDAAHTLLELENVAPKGKQASIESLLFSNPYVPRAADFGTSPRASQLPDNSGVRLPANLPLWMLTGGGAGSLIGAVRAEKGKRLRGALRGGAIGSAAGFFGGMAATPAAEMGDLEMAYHRKPHTEFSTPARVGTVAAPYALAGAGALLGGHVMADGYDKAVQHGEEATRKYHEDKKKKDDMNTKQSAQKIAKVYEAGESVEGAKPKVVYESHKKCTPGEFGAMIANGSASKVAADPRAVDMNPGSKGSVGKNTALIGGQFANPTPEYAPDRAWDASRAGLDFRRLRHRHAQNAFGNQVIDAAVARRRNENEGRNMNQLSAASGLAPHIGAAIGQPLLGAAAGMAGTAIGGLGANKAHIDRPAVMQDLQKQKQNYESVTPPNQRTIYQMPFFGKSSNFGARVKEAVKTAEAVKIQAQFPAPTPGIVDYLRTMLATGTVGGGVGALVGATRAPKGKRLRTALGDAAVGGAAGMGFGAGTLGGISTGAAMDSQNNNSGIPAYLGGLGGALGGASAGALAHKIRNEMEDDYDNNDSPLLNSLAKQGSYTGNFLQHYPMAMRYTVPTTTMVGSLLGAGHGALSDSGAMRGAVRGGLMGAGAGAGTVLGGGLVPSVSGDVGFQPGPEIAVPATIGGGVAGGMAGASGGNALYNMLERRLDTERKPRKKDKKEKQSALSHEGLDVISMGGAGGLAGGMYGGLAGLLGGGLHGAIDPGHTLAHDDKGNVVGQKRRNRLLGALRGGVGYGALGAGAGATVGGVGGLAVENAVPGSFRRLIGNANWADLHDAKAKSDMEQGLNTAGRALEGWFNLPEKDSAYGFGSKVAEYIYDPDFGNPYARANSLTSRALDAGSNQFLPSNGKLENAMADSNLDHLDSTVARKAVGNVAGLLGGQGIGRAAEGAMGLAQLPGTLSGAANVRNARRADASARATTRADFLEARRAANNTTGAPTGSYTGKRPVNFVPDYGSSYETFQHADELDESRLGRPLPPAVRRTPADGKKPTPRVSPAVLQGGASFKPPVAPQQPLMPGGKTSAYEFGGKVAAFNWSDLKNPALGGAAVGAMAGGVHGLLSPGEDEDGKKRNRFGAMLRGVVGGGAIGGIGGAAAGYFAPGPTNDFMNRLRHQYTMNTPVPTQAQARTRQNFNAAGEEPFEEDGMVNPAMQAAQG